jgi:hypothetical protein
MPHVVPKCPRTTSAQNKKFYTQFVFLGLFDATSPCNNLLKIWKTNLCPACDSEAIFSAASAVFEGGGDGRGFGGFIFLAMQGQPSHSKALYRYFLFFLFFFFGGGGHLEEKKNRQPLQEAGGGDGSSRCMNNALRRDASTTFGGAKKV